MLLSFRPVLSVVLLCLSVAVRAQETPPVVINEIHYDPADPGTPLEFIELYNNGTQTVDLSGWAISSAVDYSFPEATMLGAGGYLVVAGSPTDFASRWGFSPLGPWSGKLSNSGETIKLRDAGGELVDEVDYQPGFPWPTGAAGEGPSIELINPALDNDVGGSWRSSGQAVAVREAQVYVPINDTEWHYRKGTSEASSPVEAWREVGFAEDASWLIGQTSVGYGDNDDNTIITDMSGHYNCMFLRRVFTVRTGEVPGSLRLKVRVDDGCIVWINGHEVGRFYFPANTTPTYTSLANNHESASNTFDEIVLGDVASYLVNGENVLAIQAFNSSRNSSDFTIDAGLEEIVPDLTTEPTPGAKNSVYSLLAPPAIRQVEHQPEQPASGQDVTVTAKISDPDGVAGAVLHYQVVNPGSYIRLTDANYESGWTDIAMHDDGLDGDTVAADGVFTAVIPGTQQVHRRLIRYRITSTDNTQSTVTVPYADDPSPNFAYFVYDGVPAWSGAFNPGVTNLVEYSPELLESLPVYQLIANKSDVVNSQYSSSYNGQRFYGTLVYDGKVYDHILFNNRGEASTYVSGKNKWRIHFTNTHDLVARDNLGKKYNETWDELNLNACSSPWCAVHRGMSGVEEAVSLRLYELLGMASPKSHYLHFRVIDEAAETGSSQYQGGNPSGVNGGDLWGLYLAVEQPDGSFLDERDLPDGNLYKIEGSVGDKKHQAETQPTDTSDWNAFLSASKSSQTEAWWRENMNLEAYYNFHAGNRILGNVDVRYGYNHYFYHAPDGHWTVVPWDLDMMFIPKTHWSGIIDQNNCLSLPAIKIEFQNRARELLDLVCENTEPDGGQIGQLIDEYAQIIRPGGTSPNWTELDAAMWNYNPRTPSTSNAQTNHRGNFYQTPYTDSRIGGTWVRTLSSADFSGSLNYLTEYATDTFPANSTWTLNNGNQHGYGYQYLKYEGTDSLAPARPSLTRTGSLRTPINDLRFVSGAYSGSNAFSAMQWRVGEISAPGIPLYDPEKPRKYEVSDVWRSGEIPVIEDEVTLPPEVLKVGHTYRVRVRHKDVTGRWSRWSSAIQFVPAAAITQIRPDNLVISEFMYNPPALSTEETAAGITDKQLFEYIELLNVGSQPLDLSGLAFTDGIDFTFPEGTLLEAGQRILVVKDLAAFTVRYGEGLPVAGEFANDTNLSNGGETVTLSYLGTTIQSFTYSDGSHPADGETVDPWPAGADGDGYSLVLKHPESVPDESQVENWELSTASGGNPGKANGVDYASWVQGYPEIGAQTEDPDGDGLANLAEYALDTDPTAVNPASGFPVARVESLEVNGSSADFLALSFTHPTDRTDVVCSVEFSTDLKIWEASGVLVQSVDDGQGRITETWRAATPLSEATRAFVRLRVATVAP